MDDGRISLLSRDTFANPHPVARRLREHDPVHWSDELGAWVLTRHADVAACLHDARLSAERLPALERLAEFGLEPLRPLFSTMRRMFLFRDPPEHTRLRRSVNRAFTRPSTEMWRREIDRLTHSLLDTMAGYEHVDLLTSLAQPLPLSIIRLVLGIPEEAQPRLKAWSEDISRFFGRFGHTHQQLARIQASVFEFTTYLRELLDQRRGESDGALDLLSVLAHDPDEALGDEDILANAVLLVAAGHVTTTDLIGNGAWAMLESPPHADELRARSDEPGFVDGAVEEILRCESPVQMTARLVREPVEIDGRHIRPGQWIILWLGAANRDPARFTDPDRLDFGRADNRHLGFGIGNHFCIGAPLARLQAQIALPALFRRFPAMRIDGPLVWEHKPTLRGLTSLPVRLR